MTTERMIKCQELLHTHKLDALIIDYPIDLFYLIGLHLSLGRLLITAQECTLFVDGRYYEEACQKNLPCKIALTSGYDAKSAFGLSFSFQNKRIGFDSFTTPHATFLEAQTLGGEWIALKSPIKRLREIKEVEEIAFLRKAAHLGSLGFDYVCNLLKVGITEEEVALELELYWRKAGGDKLSFASHIAFGAHSSKPHYHSGKKELQKGDIVLIDIGVVCNDYHSDMTRVVFFKEPHHALEKIYPIVHAAQQAALSLCRPGVLIKDLDQAARTLISEEGYGKEFPHSLGHGIGLEIHEYPVVRGTGDDAKRVLREGMVITIEPGIYLPGVGGIRLEDAIVITKEGHENLTQRPLSISLPVII